MKPIRSLAGMAFGLAGVLAGCDGTPTASTTPSTGSSTISGRAAIDSGTVQVTDANGDSVVRAPVEHGGFTLHLPGDVRFPILVLADSAGFQLRTLVPSRDSAAFEVLISKLTDSAAIRLGAEHRPPRHLEPKEWKDRLDSLRPVLDTVRPPRPPRDTARPDSLKPHHPDDSLHPRDTAKPPVPPKDTLRLPPPPHDSLFPRDTTRHPLPPVPPTPPQWHPSAGDSSSVVGKDTTTTP